MIRKRKQKLFNESGRKLEYYLESLGEWLTPAEMVKLKGCNIKAESLKGRISNVAKNPEFETLDGCVFIPKKVGNGMQVKESKTHRDRKNITSEFDRWIKLHKLWPILQNKQVKPLIMQSRKILC